MASAVCLSPAGGLGLHLERADRFGQRRGDALRQAFGAELVHQEADRAAVHAVDELAGAHRLAQRLQQKAVAAKRHHHVRLGDRRLAIARDQFGGGGARVLDIRRHERQSGDGQFFSGCVHTLSRPLIGGGDGVSTGRCRCKGTGRRRCAWPVRLRKPPPPINCRSSRKANTGEVMARAPNYNQERKERDRQKAAKKAEKALAKAAKSGRTPKEEERRHQGAESRIRRPAHQATRFSRIRTPDAVRRPSRFSGDAP